MVLALNFLGMIEVYAGHAEQGLAILEQSRALCGEGVDVDDTLYQFLGLAHCRLKIYEHGQVHLQYGLERIMRSENELYRPYVKGPALIPNFEDALAITALSLGDLQRAAQLLGAAHQTRESFGIKEMPIDSGKPVWFLL
jgi:hypothetical protein